MSCRVLLQALLISSIAFAQDNYDYKQHGADWTGLCATGKRQSPINFALNDLIQTSDDAYERFDMNYPDMPNWIKKDLTNSYAVFGDMGTFTNANPTSTYASQYAGWGMYYHAPSEHTLNDKQFDLELHLVHTANMQPMTEYQNTAIIAVVFQLDGNDNPLLNSIFNNGTISLSSLFNGATARDFAMYSGSLTVPPCTENVNWYLYQKQQSISQTQLDFFKDFWANNPNFANGNGNNRETQNKNGRKIYAYVPASSEDERLEYF